MRRPGYEVLMLLVPEVAVDVAAFDEVGMAPDVVDLAALEDEDRIALTSDDSRCERSSSSDPRRFGARLALTMASLLRIERAGRLVEDQDARVGDQRPGDRQALALAARQVGRIPRKCKCHSRGASAR